MTSCSLRRLQELAAQHDRRINYEVAALHATKESERASSLSECQSNTTAL